MKKLFATTLITILCMVTFLNVPQVQAEDNTQEEGSENSEAVDVQVTLEGESSIHKGNEKYKLELKLGEFTGVDEGNVMAFEGVLDYNSEVFGDAEVTGQNGWDVTYDAETKRIVGISDKASANTVIAQFEFTVKDNATISEDTRVALNEFYITDDIVLNKSIESLSKDGIKLSSKTNTNNENSESKSSNVKVIVIVAVVLIAIVFLVLVTGKKNKP